MKFIKLFEKYNKDNEVVYNIRDLLNPISDDYVDIVEVNNNSFIEGFESIDIKIGLKSMPGRIINRNNPIDDYSLYEHSLDLYKYKDVLQELINYVKFIDYNFASSSNLIYLRNKNKCSRCHSIGDLNISYTSLNPLLHEDAYIKYICENCDKQDFFKCYDNFTEDNLIDVLENEHNKHQNVFCIKLNIYKDLR